MQRFHLKLGVTIFLAAAALAGCSDDTTPGAAACAHPLGDACAGVPAEPVCGEDVCTAGVTCSSVATVSDAGALGAAASKAASGSCIALAPGSYGKVDLPAGVSLLGRGSEFVHVDGVKVAAGSGAVVRGVSVGAGGVVLDGALDARLEAVRITASGQSGVDLGGGSSATLAHVEIGGSSLYGLRAVDAAKLSVEASVIADSKGPGLWAECSGGCACTERGSVSLTGTVLSGNQLVGAALVGVDATFDGVEIRGTLPRSLVGGGGVSVASCATLTATDTTVADNRMYGVLVDGSSAKLGGPSAEEGVEISGNHVGLWVQGQAADGSQSVEVNHARLLGNSGVGIGSSGDIVGFVIYGTEIRNTKSENLTVDEGGQKTVGDGLVWGAGAQIAIDGLTLEGNERQSILIDGAAGEGSKIANVTLAGADAQKGILQQSVMSGTDAPEVGAGAPPVTQKSEKVLPVPTAPAAPSAL